MGNERQAHTENLFEQFRALLDELALTSDPRMEMRQDIQSGIETLLTHYVAPHAPANPTVLDVGFGMRPEEFLALRDALNPSQIVGIESGNLGDIGFPKWKHYRRGLQQYDREELDRLVTVRPDDVWGMDGEEYDIVCAFSIAPLLQNARTIRDFHNMATSVVVITTYINSIYTFDGRVEHEHINYLLDPYADELLVRHESIVGPTTDGYIWVMKTR